MTLVTNMKVFASGVAAAALLATASPAPAQTRQVDLELTKARQKISMIEGVLERAVQNGADNLLRQIQQIAPIADSVMLTGAPRVRGFRVEPLGVFFDVEVPSLRLAMAWPYRSSLADSTGVTAQALSDLRTLLDRHVSDPGEREQVRAVVQRLERQVVPASSSTRAAATTTLPPGNQGADTPVDTSVLENPGQAWRNEVRSALVDAMIENTGGITVAADEFVVVAARGAAGSDRLIIDDASDSRTIQLRLKGSDLAAYRANSISLDEARRRVEVREY